MAREKNARIKNTNGSKASGSGVPETEVQDTDAGSEIVALDRRKNERRTGEATTSQFKSIIAEEKKKARVQRRRQIDPTTCERDYSEDEVEFMKALEQYKRSSGRMFPTCSEILEVIRSLGYAKQETPTCIILDTVPSTTDSMSAIV